MTVIALIGSLIVGMSSRTDGLKKGFKSARKTIGNFAEGVTSGTSALVAFGGAVAGVVATGALATIVKGSLDAANATSLLAQRVGTSTKAMSELGYAASTVGIDADEFGDALSDMGEKLGDAAAIGGDGREALAKLGLSLDEVRAMSPEDAFTTIAEAISGVENQADRLNIADQMFGGSGQRMIPLLQQGAEGINALRAEAEMLGISLDDVDAAKAQQASLALNKAGAALTGAGQKLAVILAPYIEAAAEKFTELVGSVVDGSTSMGGSIEWVGSAVGIAADTFNVLKIVGLGVWSALTQGTAWLYDGIAFIGKGLEGVLNMLPGVEVSFGGALEGIAAQAQLNADSAREALGDALAAEPPGANVEEFFNGIGTAAQAAAEKIAEANTATEDFTGTSNQLGFEIAEVAKELQAQIDTFGMSGAAMDIQKLKMAGATDEQLAGVVALNDRLAAMEEEKALAEELQGKASSLIESTRSPVEVFQAEIEEMRELFNKGLIDEEVFGRGLDQAKDALLKEQGQAEEVGFAGALDSSSAEARSALLRASGIGKDDGIKDLAKINRDQYGSQVRAERYLSNMERYLSNQSGGAVIDFV